MMILRDEGCNREPERELNNLYAGQGWKEVSVIDGGMMSDVIFCF